MGRDCFLFCFLLSSRVLQYYLGLATRQSSLHYAAHAALLARAFRTFARQPTTTPASAAACESRAETFVASARQAFAFGARTDLRVAFKLFDKNFSAADAGAGTEYENVTWTEPAEPGTR